MQDLTILIPCLNEAKTIGDVIYELQALYPEIPLFIVDNGSSDGSQQIIQSTNANLLIAEKKGKANAIKYALDHINTRYVLLLDADNEYSISSIQHLLRFKFNPNMMILGMRCKSNMLLRSKLANYVISMLTYLRCRRFVHDCLTGLRIVPYNLLRQVKSQGFEIETELNILALSLNMNIVSVDIDYTPRIEGKKIKFVDMFKLLRVAFQ